MTNRPSVNTSGRYRLRYRGVACLNCGHPLDISDKYCPNCSQANSTKKLTILDFLEEFFSNVVSYDSKVLQTLKGLMLRPGTITKEYINGKRATYTNPFRFLLGLAISYFLLIGLKSNFEQIDRLAENSSGKNFDLNSTIIENIPFEDENEKETVISQMDSLDLVGKVKRKSQKRDSVILSDPMKHFNGLKGKSFFDRYFSKQEFFGILIEKDTVYGFDQLQKRHPIEPTMENKMAYSSATSFIKVKRQPGSYINSLFSKLPFTTFFFLPVFAIFVWLVYIRKNYTYTDHLIFSFHNQSLLFILLIISYLTDSVFGTTSAFIFVAIFSVYLYKAMRNFYAQGRFKTIIKYLFLNAIFVILATMGVIALVAGSAFTY